MAASREQIRTLIRYEFQLGHSAAQATRNICSAEGEGTVDESTVRRWYRKLRLDKENIDDKPRSGRPSLMNNDDLKQLVEADPSQSSRILANQMGTSQSSAIRHLHEIGKVYKKGLVIPYQLNEFKKQQRVEACQELLVLMKQGNFLKRIITSDEKWVLYDNRVPNHQWVDSGEQPDAVPVADFRQRKLLLCVWWNSHGLIHYELLPRGETINAVLYSQQLQRVQNRLMQIHPGLVNRNRVMFLQDNARPHTAALTQQKLLELHWELLPHPPYSPDIAPTDYHLFCSMEHFLRGKIFNNDADVDAAVRNFFNEKPACFYRRGIELLPSRWQRVIDNNGDYID